MLSRTHTIDRFTQFAGPAFGVLLSWMGAVGTSFGEEVRIDEVEKSWERVSFCEHVVLKDSVLEEHYIYERDVRMCQEASAEHRRYAGDYFSVEDVKRLRTNVKFGMASFRRFAGVDVSRGVDKMAIDEKLKLLETCRDICGRFIE